MIPRPLLGLLLLGGALPMSAQDASVTLFQNGQTLVRREVPLALPAGPSRHTLPLGLFEPASLAVLDPGVRVTRLSYDPATSEEALLRRSIGQRFSWYPSGAIREAETAPRTATLIGLDPERWRLEPEGRVQFGRPGTLLWPADRVPAEPGVEVEVTSDRARSGLPVMYQTTGGGWSAQYRFFVGSSTRVEGVAQIPSGHLALANAEVQLLAGDIGAPPPVMAMADMVPQRAVMMTSAKAAMVEERVGEAHLYTLPGRVSFVPGSQAVVPLFAPVQSAATRHYRVTGALGWYGGVRQAGDEEEVPVQVSWRLDRARGTAFGDLPLPGGGVAIYEVDRVGRPQLVGQGAIGHTAAGSPLEVQTGTAFDLTAKRTQTEYTTVPGANGRVTATIGYTVVLTNAGDAPVTVEVVEDRRGEWSVLASSVTADRRSTSVTAFRVPVPARGSATLTYRMRVVW